MDTERFEMWVEERLIPLLGCYERGEPRSIVIMDNATIHSRLEPLIEAAGAKLIYTAPYSPELNPIELMFGSYKASLKRYRQQSHHISHIQSLYSVTPEIARAYVKHCKVPLCSHFLSQNEIARRKKVYQECMNTIQICAAVLLLTKVISK